MRLSSNPAWLCTSPGPVYLSLDEVGAKDCQDGDYRDREQQDQDEVDHHEEELGQGRQLHFEKEYFTFYFDSLHLISLINYCFKDFSKIL